MEWPCFSVVATGDGPSRGQVGAPAAQRGRTSLTPVRAVAGLFTEQQGWVSAPGSPSRILERDNGACACQRPALSGCSNPPPGRSGDKMLDWGPGVRGHAVFGGRRRQGPWRQARCGRRPRHICCAVGQGTRASSSSQAATGRGRSGTGASAASPSPIRVWRTRRASLRATVRAARLPSTRALTWV
jgi:hypothetical protein